MSWQLLALSGITLSGRSGGSLKYRTSMSGKQQVRGKHKGMVGRRKKTSEVQISNCLRWGSIKLSYILLLPVHHQDTIMQAKFCSEVIFTDFKRCCVVIQHVREGFDPITPENLYDCFFNEETASIFYFPKGHSSPKSKKILCKTELRGF